MVQPTQPSVRGHHGNIQAAHGLIENAFKQGLIPYWYDPGHLSIAKVPHVSALLQRQMSVLPYRQTHIDRATDQLDEPARDTRAQLYQDSFFFWRGGPFLPGYAYELARFVAAPDQTGYVKSVWTSLVIDNGGGGVVLLDPQDPFAHERVGCFARWHLRLYQGTFQPIGPFASGPVGQIVGSGFPPLNRWDDLRFLWGRTQTNVFHLIPSDFCLRLFIEIIMPGRLTEIGGRLIGYTQPIDTKPAGYNARYGY